MSVADQSVPQANVAGRVPFTVRISPQFVNRMCDRLRRSAPTQATVAGLLFGRAHQDVSELQVFRSIPDEEMGNALSGSPNQLNDTIERLIASSRNDPEVSALSLLGWYSFRATGGLHESDVAFHNRFFRQPNEVALILRPEQHPNVLFEIYSKSGATLLSEEEHRWGSLRLATDTTVAGPIDIAMRAKIGDDFYLRAYQVSKTLDRAERREHWLGAVDATRSTFRSIFRQKRRDTYTRDAAAETMEPAVANDVTGSPVTPAPAPLARAAAAAAEPPVASRPSFATAPQALESSFSKRAREQSPAMSADRVAVQKIVAGDPPSLPAVIKAPKKGVPWISSFILFAIAAGATAAIYLQGFANTADTPRFLRAIFPDTGLGLRVEGQGDRVLLSWNRRNALVRASNGGVLHIDDGPQHRDVKLDSSQIANGSVLYRPGSDDVSFRLEIHGAQGAAVAETTRVLDGVKAEPLEAKSLAPDLSAAAPPAPAAAPSATTTAPRDQRAHPADKAPTPLAKQLTYPPAPPLADTRSERSATPESRPPAVREGASSPPPATPVFTPSASNSPVSGTAANSTASKPTDLNPASPSTSPEPRPSLTPPPTANETARPTPSPAGPDTSRPPDTSKVSNWEDTASSTKPVQPPQLRTAPPLSPDPVRSGPGTEANTPATFVPPKPLKQVLPDLRSLTPGAIATAAQLEVAVRVNKKGHVTEAYLVGDASKVAPHLARAALNAAKQWTFQPATIRGKNVPSDHTIVFEFRPTSR